MLYQVAYDHLVQAVEIELVRRGYQAGLGQVLVDLHLDERHYVMPVSVDLSAQQPLLRGVAQENAVLERLASAVEFEDLTSFGGVFRVFARTLLNRAGVNDMVRGQAANDAATRHHIVPRVERVLEAIVATPQYEPLTDYDTLLALIESAAADHLNADGPQGLLPEDLSTIQALRAAGANSTREKVGVVAERCGLQGWVKWTRGLYTGVRCLSSSSGLDLERFRATVRRSIDGGRSGPLALGLVFEDSVQEMGLALAMSFFGDLGYKEFAKPDRHVVNGLMAYEGACPTERHAFERLQWHSLQAGIGPRRLDKVFYLAGSGNFYLTGFNFGPAFKAHFLERLRDAGGQRLVDPTHRHAAEAGDAVPRPQLQEQPLPADQVEAMSAAERFYESISGSIAAQRLVGSVKTLCEELQAEVHHTNTAGGDLRVRANRPQPHPQEQNVITMSWTLRNGRFYCQAFVSPAECVELGLPAETVQPNPGSLHSRFTVRPGIDDEAFLRVVKRSVNRFRGL